MKEKKGRKGKKEEKNVFVGEIIIYICVCVLLKPVFLIWA